MALIDVYTVVLHFAALAALLRYRHADRAMRIFCWLLWLTDFAEMLAILCAKRYHNNMVVYAFFNPLQLGLIGFYFNGLIEAFRRYRVGQIVFGASAMLAVANAIWLQPLDVMNTNFLLLDGLVTICMALVFFSRLMLKEGPEGSMLRNPHFWIAMSLVFFWAATFSGWGLYNYLILADNGLYQIMNVCLLSSNIVSYGVFAIVLFLYPKTQPQPA